MRNSYIEKALELLKPYPDHHAAAKIGVEKFENAKISVADLIELMNNLADDLRDQNATLPVEMRFLAVSIMEEEFEKMRNVVSIFDKIE